MRRPRWAPRKSPLQAQPDASNTLADEQAPAHGAPASVLCMTQLHASRPWELALFEQGECLM